MDKETSEGQVLSGELESFFQEIADEIFLLPPINSRGHKFRHMLWNHLNLKMEIKTRFDEEIFSRWQSFQKMSTVRKSAKLSDTDRVIQVILKSKKGINVATLSNETGLDGSKIRNIISRALKKDRIQRIARGIYAGV